MTNPRKGLFYIQVLFLLSLFSAASGAFAAADQTYVNGVTAPAIACNGSGRITINMYRKSSIWTPLNILSATQQFGYRLNLPAGVSIVNPNTSSFSVSSFSSSFGANYLNVSGALPALSSYGSVSFDLTGNVAGTYTINSSSFTNKSGLSSVTANTTVAVGACPKPVLTGTLTGPGTASVNTAFNFSALVYNAGNGATSGTINLTGTLPAGLSFVSGSSPGGFSCSAVSQAITCSRSAALAAYASDTVTLTAKPTTSGTFNFSMGLSGGGSASATTNSVSTFVASQPVLKGTLSGPASATLNTAYSYSVAVANIGTKATSGTISLAAILPTSLSFVSGSSTGGFTCSAIAQSVSCNRSTALAANATDTLNLSVKPTAAGTYNFGMNLSGGGATASTTNSVATTVTALPVFSGTLSGPATATLNTAYNYSLVVRNTGAGATTSPINLASNLPTGLSFISGSSAGGFTCSATGQSVSCSRSAVLAANATDTVTLSVKPTTAGTYNVSVNLSGGGSVAASSNTVTTTVAAAATLSGVLSGPTASTLNVAYAYSITITNTGAATTGTISLSGTLPAGLSFVSGSSPGGFACSAAGQAIACSRTASLAANAADTVTLSVKPTTAATVSFSMNLSGGGATAVTTNTVSTTSSAQPDLSVSLAQPAPALKATALSEVPVTVSNNGSNVANAPISLTFNLPANVSAPLKFARNADAWVCLTSNATTSCTYGKALAIGASTTVRLPVIPAAATVGTAVGAFGASVTQSGGETNTANNTATPMVPAGTVGQLALTSLLDPLYSTPILDPTTIPKYALPLPNAFASFFRHTPTTNAAFPGTDLYTLDIKQVKTHILPPGFPATDVFAYGDPARPDTFTYPAHTIVARSTDPASNASGLGRAVKVTYRNTNAAQRHLLPVDRSIHGANLNEPDIRSVAHLHGIKSVNQNSDGYPEAWYSPTGQTGDQFSMTSPTVGYNANPFDYLNKQEATLLWYHDHTLGMTRLNVYAGLAGLYLLRDDNEMNKIAANQLPSGPYELPLVLQDRMFHTDGTLAYPDVDLNGTAATPSMVPEFFGSVMLVNGVAWPYLEVEPRKYRFRVLNGSSSRFYNLYLSNSANFQVIGTEGGFLNGPVTVNTLTIGPAERYDLIVDFSASAGQTITVINSAAAPFPGGAAVVAGLDDQIMQFRVNQPLSATPHPSVPANLRASAVPIIAPTPGTLARQVLLAETVDNNNRILPILGTVADGMLGWMDTVTETPRSGTVEQWEIFNDSADAHPIHLHGGHFQVISRQDFAALPGVNGSLTNISFPAGPSAPLAQELTWKDTVITYPGQVTRINVKFEDKGQFVWHCHILEHEDHDMMRPMQIQ